MIKIKWKGYKYAPESVRVSANGQRISTDGTNIATKICCGNTAGAMEEIKKKYRQQIRQEKRYTYAYLRENSRQFYYISCLRFSESASIEEKLHCYKELKHHLQRQPVEIITESWHITPTGATAPEVKREPVTIDFSRLAKVQIIDR